MFGPIGTPELVIILVVVLLIFGVGRISGIGRELGSSIKEFRRAVKTEDEDTAEANANVQQTQVQQPPQQSGATAAPQQEQPQQQQQQQQQTSNNESANTEPQKNIF